jgi:hypothetical protein
MRLLQDEQMVINIETIYIFLILDPHISNTYASCVRVHVVRLESTDEQVRWH